MLQPLVSLPQVLEATDTLELEEELAAEEEEEEEDALLDSSVVLVTAEVVRVTVAVIESVTVVDATVEPGDELEPALAYELDNAVDVIGSVEEDADTKEEVVEEGAGDPGTKRVTPNARTPASAIATMTPSNVRLRNIMRSSGWLGPTFSPIFRTKDERRSNEQSGFRGVRREASWSSSELERRGCCVVGG